MMPSAGVVDDQVGELPALLLGGCDEAAVLDEGARVDEVGDVLPGGTTSPGVPRRDLLGARRVGGQEASRHDLVETSCGWLLLDHRVAAHRAFGSRSTVVRSPVRRMPSQESTRGSS